MSFKAFPLLLATLAVATVAHAAPAPSDTQIPATFAWPTTAADYEKRVVMIPMRDGVKLHTVIVVPKGAKGAPILLTRTPYDADGRASRTESNKMLSILPQGDEVFVEAGYIRVFQDIRGKFGSEGDYVVTRPPVGALNKAKTDHITDAYDTIDWLVKNVPETNGKVGMIGSSYEGFTVVMALLGPHPALKVAAPESPMIDGWMGDDWFHYGAFRQANIDWIGGQTGFKGKGDKPPSTGLDDYETFRRLGAAGEWAKMSGYDRLPFWTALSTHVAYDSYWSEQALDKLVAANPSNVPTIWLQGLWDQEDMYGAITTWEALKAKGKAGSNYLVMVPWRHSVVNYDCSSLGPLQFDGDTALQFRRDVLLPFFNQYLKDGAPSFAAPPVFIYNTGENHWDRLADWPLACDNGCTTKLTSLYLQDGFGLGFGGPAAGEDSYVSDPAKPVPYLARPISFSDSARWKEWLVGDQRIVDGRPDVLTYQTAPLTAPVRVSGAPIADIYAKTTGTDGDFVVKVIDVYPDEVASNPKMGGYQLPIALDIFRGRYRDSFAKPTPIPADAVQRYSFRLPTVNHVFLPGHRIMVQIQSTLFPLYDRNPQTYVDNIFFAKPADYRKATITIERGGTNASAVRLPVVPVAQAQVAGK